MSIILTVFLLTLAPVNIFSRYVRRVVLILLSEAIFCLFTILTKNNKIIAPAIITNIQLNCISIVPLFLVALILWDLSYRLGVGLWSAIIAFRRSTKFLLVSGMRTKMRYTAYQELKTLKRVDSINFAFGIALFH